MTTDGSQADAGSRKGAFEPFPRRLASGQGACRKEMMKSSQREQIKSGEQVPYVLWEAWGINSDSWYYRK